jgi:ATP-dependent Clp protease ATP-binding subunit ClpC
VILFDEIEKASSDVLNILLQVLDEGQLKDAKGRIIDFKNTIIIMTSNIGSEEFIKKQSTIGFATGNTTEKKDKDFEQVKARVLEEMKNFLTPELLNRIDYKIVFKHLEKDILAKIMKNKINIFLEARKNNSDITLPKYTDKQIKEIIEKIYEPQYGARPLDRYIQDDIEPQLIQKIMNPQK